MGRTSTSTIANPEKIAPSTKNGANSVECHPGTSAIAKSHDTTLWTESTSGVAIDRRAPARAEQIEDGRDQRPGVADADPEHERGDVHRPHLGHALAGHAHAPPHLARPREEEPGQPERYHAHPGEVEVARRVQRPQDVTVDVGERGRRRGPGVAHRLRRAPARPC